MALPIRGRRRPGKGIHWLDELEEEYLDPPLKPIAGETESQTDGIVTPTGQIEALQLNGFDRNVPETAASTPSTLEEESGRKLQPLTSVRQETSRETGCRVKLRMSRPQIFMDTMEAWYLSVKKRRTLTKTLLKRKAVQVAANIRLETGKIPRDWISTLQKNVGLEVFSRHKGGRKAKPVKPQAILDDDDIPTNNLDSVDIKKEIKKRDDMRVTSCGRIIKAPKVLILTKGGSHTHVKVTEVIDLTHDVYECKTSTQDKSSQEKKPKIIDRSGELPPTWWIEKYNSTGIAPPRELVFYTIQDKTVVYYDYELPESYYSNFRTEKEEGETAAVADLGRRQMRVAHDGNKCEWWAKKC